MRLAIPNFALAFGTTLAFIGYNSSHALAEKIVHTTEFNVNYTGIRVGYAKFIIEIDGNAYNLKASGSTKGLARLFSQGTGKLESSGKFGEGAVVSQNHMVQVSEKGKTEKLVMSFDDGNLGKVETLPHKKPKTGKNYVPILDAHLQSIIDPASSLVVPAKENATSGQEICNRTLNLYDGETRFDMKLSYKKTRPIKTDGYKGLAYVCKLKYIPIAGHRKKHRSVEYMRKNERMELWLAPITGTNIFTPIKIDVGSQIGRFVAYPKRFKATVVK